jgi:hypothetical protein
MPPLPKEKEAGQTCPHCGYLNDAGYAFCILCRMDMSMPSAVIRKGESLCGTDEQGILYYYSNPIRVLAAAAWMLIPLLLEGVFYSSLSHALVYGLTRFIWLYFIFTIFLFPPITVWCFWRAKTLLESVTDESVIVRGLILLSNFLMYSAVSFGLPPVFLSAAIVFY